MKSILVVYLLLLFGVPLALTITLAVRRRTRTQRDLSARFRRFGVPVEEIMTRVAGEREAERRREARPRRVSGVPDCELDTQQLNLGEPQVCVRVRARRYIQPGYRTIFPRN